MRERQDALTGVRRLIKLPHACLRKRQCAFGWGRGERRGFRLRLLMAIQRRFVTVNFVPAYPGIRKQMLPKEEIRWGL